MPLPSDPSVTVTIRKLSWKQQEEAQRVSQRQSRVDIKDMGGIDEFRKLMAAITTDETPTVKTAPDPLATHDKWTVLVCGVKSWTSPEAVTPEALDQLSTEDAEGLARAVLDLTMPSPTLETDRKNDA